jgi:hypothetical protein
MTRNSDRFVNSVAAFIAGTQIISEMVVLTPTRHLVCGLSFERTPTKDYYYLWKLVVPLFSPMMENISLNYSHRIDIRGARGPFYIGGDCQDLARDVASTFHAIFEKGMTRGYGVPELIKIAEEMGKVRSNMMLEVAIAYGIIGNFNEARRRLEKILALNFASPILPRVKEIAAEILVAIDLRNGTFAHLVQTWEERNIQIHFPGLLTLKPVSL